MRRPATPGDRAAGDDDVDVVDVVDGAELTVATRGDTAERLFGPVTMTYAVCPAVVGSRLVAVVRQGRGRARLERARGLALAWGDLPMMRKQLLTLGDLAEATPVSGS